MILNYKVIVGYISTEATFDMKVSSVEKLPHTSRDARNF